MPFTTNAARRHHIPKQKRKVTNWATYDASLLQRGSLTVWLTDEAITAWQAVPRTTHGGQRWYSGHPDSADAEGGVSVPFGRRVGLATPSEPNDIGSGFCRETKRESVLDCEHENRLRKFYQLRAVKEDSSPRWKRILTPQQI
jgi:hypothetical protein